MDFEVEEAVMQPHFDAVLDIFDGFEPVPGFRLRVRHVKYGIVAAAHDAERHFARTRTDGKWMELAPEMADLPCQAVDGILAHEFGHVVDFLYPGFWSWPIASAGQVSWVGRRHAEAWRVAFGNRQATSRRAADDSYPAQNWMRAWEGRTADQIEWAADGIAQFVTGTRIGYSGPCMLQCPGHGVDRPNGLR